jgi:hypothetical protein
MENMIELTKQTYLILDEQNYVKVISEKKIKRVSLEDL